MRYYLIAGEASGDLHASNLMKSLKAKDLDADFRFWGGDLMQSVGGDLIKHYRDLAFMGFVEVAKNIRTILGNIKFCKKDILEYKPDVLILIDYPGFNLRIADWAKQQDIKIFYYISPQIWAWHKSRIHQIKANVDKMFVILPFEKAFYQQYDYEVEFHGHPLMDVVQDYEAKSDFLERNELSNQPIIALLPGSRRQEIDRLLSVMLQMIPLFEDYQFVIAAAPATPLSVYQEIIKNQNIDLEGKCEIVQNQTYDLLQYTHAALVTSGTATLETALFNVPQVVCYKTSFLTYQIAKNLVDIKYISLVNLIADELIVKELIQENCTPQQLKQELSLILEGDNRTKMLSSYKSLREQLGTSKVAESIADVMIAAI